MIYFDSAYLAKLYLNEPDSAPVRALAGEKEIVSCSSHGQVELAYVFHRKWREGALSRAGLVIRMDQVKADANQGVLSWLPITEELWEAASRSVLALEKKTLLRAADALHLVCAKENGFAQIYSNDRHLLAAAGHFGLRGKNVIP